MCGEEKYSKGRQDIGKTDTKDRVELKGHLKEGCDYLHHLHPYSLSTRGLLTVHHILVVCNHLPQTKKNIFGRKDVVQLFRFHPTLVLLSVLFTLLIHITDHLFCTSLYTVITS